MKAYCLNLDRCPDRLAQMAEQFGRIGQSFLRIPAVDAATPELREAYARRCDPDMTGHRISLGAFACFESHRQAWRMMIADGQAHALVLEDDLVVTQDFGRYLDEGWFPPGADIVRLETDLTRVHIACRAEIAAGPRRLCALRSRHVGTACYALTVALAKELLAESERISDPIDELLFNPGSRLFDRLRILQMVPAPAIQADRLPIVDVPSCARSSIGTRHENDAAAAGPERLPARLTRRLSEEVRARRMGTRYTVIPFG